MNKHVKVRNKEVKSKNIEQAATQDDSRSFDELPSTKLQVKCISPKTFSQKLYQSHALEIAEEYEQAIEANSLEKLQLLLDKALELDRTTE